MIDSNQPTHNIINYNNELPNGAVEHVLQVNTEVQNEVREVLRDFKEVFPDELPVQLPPMRGIDDVHYITV